LPRSLMQVVLLAALTAALTGCATTGSLRATIDDPTTDVTSTIEPRTDEVAAEENAAPVLVPAHFRLEAESSPSSVLVAQAQTPSALATADAIEEEYDPWEPFNEKMFEFNLRLDRYVLKPVARAYNTVVPDRVQVMIANGFDNIQFVPRMMNSLFQGKFDGAVREFSRFLFNSTIGVGGLFDVAKLEGIEKSREDFGQTLGFYGVNPGPFLILPFLEPLTVRDGIGKGVDTFLDPLGYFIPFFWTGLLLKVEETVNDRSLNLELFQGFEESVIDFYSAVRHGYLKRREKMIKE
jgi:phospholipid-binding lipoprotein MlaA